MNRIACVVLGFWVASCRAQPGGADASAPSVGMARHAKDLQLSIDVTVKANETVAHVELKNHGPARFWINTHLTENAPDGRPELGNLVVEVVDREGSRLPYSCYLGAAMIRDTDFSFLEVNEAISADIVLSECYRLQSGLSYVAVAAYRSTYAWSPSRPDGAQQFWGALRSNEFRFIAH